MLVGARGRTEVLVVFAGMRGVWWRPAFRRPTDVWNPGNSSLRYSTSCSSLCGVGKPRIEPLSFSHHQHEVAEVQGQPHVLKGQEVHTMASKHLLISLGVINPYVSVSPSDAE